MRIAAFLLLLAAAGGALAQADACEPGGLRVYPDLGQSAPYTALVPSPDGRLLLGAASDGSLRLWDFSDGRRALEVWFHRLFQAPPEAAATPRAAFAPAGGSFFAAAMLYTTPLAYRFEYLPDGGGCVVRRSAFALRDFAEIGALAVSADGALLAVGGVSLRGPGNRHARIELFDARSGLAAGVIEPEGYLFAPQLAFMRGAAGEALLVVGENSILRASRPLRVYDAATRTVVAELAAPAAGVSGLALPGVSALGAEREGGLVVAGFHDGRVVQWRREAASPLRYRVESTGAAGGAVVSAGLWDAGAGAGAAPYSFDGYTLRLGAAEAPPDSWQVSGEYERLAAFVPGKPWVALARDDRSLAAADLVRREAAAPAYRPRVLGAAVGAVPSPDGRWLLLTYAPGGVANAPNAPNGPNAPNDPNHPQLRVGLLVSASTGAVQNEFKEAGADRGHFRFGGDAGAIVQPTGALLAGKEVAPVQEAAILSPLGETRLRRGTAARSVSVGRAGQEQIGELEIALPAGLRRVTAFDARADLFGVLLVADAGNGDQTILFWDLKAQAYTLNLPLGVRRARGVSLSADGALGMVDADEPLLLQLGASPPRAIGVELPAGTRATAAALAAGAPYAVVGLADGRVLRAGADGKTKLMGAHRAAIAFAGPGARSGRKDLAFTAGADGAVRAWFLEEAREAFTYVAFQATPPGAIPAAYGFAVVDPRGRFAASDPREAAGLHWALGLEAMSLQQLSSNYFEPALVGKHLGFSRDALIEPTPLESVKAPPQVSVASDPAAPERGLRIRFAEQDRGGYGRYVVRINNREVPLQGARALGGTIDLALRRDQLQPGRNVVEVRAYGGDDQVASRAVVSEFDLTPARPIERRLFALVVGVTRYTADRLNLRWADADARSFGEALRIAARSFIGSDDRIKIRVLTSVPKDPARGGEEAADKARILAVLDEFAQQTTPVEGRIDTVAIFLAGHGMAYKENYYFLDKNISDLDFPSDAERKRVTISGDELKAALARLPVNQLLVLDSCNSAAFLNDPQAGAKAVELDGARARTLAQLRQALGTHVLIGAWSTRSAYESSRYGHGVVTYALLRALRGAARDEDNGLRAMGVLSYAERNVPVFAGNIGYVQMPLYVPSLNYQLGTYRADDWKDQPALPGRVALHFREFVDEDSEDDQVERLTAQVNRVLEDEQARADRYDYFFDHGPPDAIEMTGRYKVDAAGMVSGKIVLRQNGKARVEPVPAAPRAQFARKVYDTLLRILPEPVAPPPS